MVHYVHPLFSALVRNESRALRWHLLTAKVLVQLEH